MYATIKAVEYYLPEGTLPNSVIASKWPEWTEKKIESKIGIAERHLSGSEEFTSDMAVIAARKLFDSGACTPEQIDFLLLCTQTPDYMLPTTACIVQAQLGLANTVGAVDISLGCSGYIYSLGYAKGLIETGQAENVLLITADTYTKLIHPDDKSIVTLFGDAASATLVCATDRSTPSIGPFVYGTDGGGANNLIVPNSGVRGQYDVNAPLIEDTMGNKRTANNLYMNGGEIFSFTLTTVPATLERLLTKAKIGLDDIDLVVFHQANLYMLKHLQMKMDIPDEKFCVRMKHCGNTVSSTIPIVLSELMAEGAIQKGQRILLVGFGVGYSWGATLVEWE